MSYKIPKLCPLILGGVPRFIGILFANCCYYQTYLKGMDIGGLKQGFYWQIVVIIKLN
jgi:hypothetical protein